MPMSPYQSDLRRRVGHSLLLFPGVSAVLFNEAGEVLLGRRSDDGTWSLLAGGIDPGEQPADAIVREIREESGVEARVDGIVGVGMYPHTYPNGDECQFLSVWFRCFAIGGVARVNDDESVDMRWFAPEALPEVSDYVRLRIETALKNDPAAWFAPPGTRHPALGF